MPDQLSDDVLHALMRLRAAVRDHGPQPRLHWRVMDQVSHKWPTLWRAICDLNELTDRLEQAGRLPERKSHAHPD